MLPKTQSKSEIADLSFLSHWIQLPLQSIHAAACRERRENLSPCGLLPGQPETFWAKLNNSNYASWLYSFLSSLYFFLPLSNTLSLFPLPFLPCTVKLLQYIYCISLIHPSSLSAGSLYPGPFSSSVSSTFFCGASKRGTRGEETLCSTCLSDVWERSL